jgi:hypothetical protein
MYYYKIKGERRIRTTPDKNVKGDPYLIFAPAFYDYWSHKDEDGLIDKYWTSEIKEDRSDVLSED